MQPPNVQPDLVLGAQIFAENCVRCHGATGAGDGEWTRSSGHWCGRHLPLLHAASSERGKYDHDHSAECAWWREYTTAEGRDPVTFTHAAPRRRWEATLFAVGSAISNTIDAQDPEQSGFETAQAAPRASWVACAGSTTYDR